jgi:CheY-like chemotaxis protein
VKVELRVSNGELEFDVEDTGSGISSGQLDVIFKPFRQISNRGRTEGGTGLGLTISKRLAELMGGRIEVESEVGVGSRFRFCLPLQEAKFESVAPEHVLDTPIDITGTRILLVEDNPVNILVANGLLSKLGCIVEAAEDGPEAVELACSKSFDAILMDVQLPTMDGLEATGAIRKHEAQTGKRTPIIALTAGTLSEEREACFAAGVDDYLSKPFTAENLLATLGRWVASVKEDRPSRSASLHL